MRKQDTGLRRHNMKEIDIIGLTIVGQRRIGHDRLAPVPARMSSGERNPIPSIHHRGYTTTCSTSELSSLQCTPEPWPA
jgi:hypothetical protein